MIDIALRFLREELANYLANDLGDGGANVELGNIALFESDDSGTVEDRLVITLVNIEEESTLKNSRPIQRIPNGGFRYVQPPIFLNLYVLFSCNYANYTSSLLRLSQVLQFFQQRSVFNVSNATTDNLFPSHQADFMLSFELYTLTFEQINHLWGSLGGRQLPSVMYKARLVKVEEPNITREGPPIEEIHAIVNNIDNC